MYRLTGRYPVASLPALGPWAPPAERGPSLESICWTSCLEHSAGGDNDIADTPYFPSTAKNLALQEIISGHHYLNQNLFSFTINLEVALLLRQFLID